jgi:hypothetical protein
MAINPQIDWANKIINIPTGGLFLVQTTPSVIFNLDLNVFRLELKGLEASESGAPFDDTHSHNTTVTIGGVTLARVIEIINGYTVTFADGQYAVNLVGANSNVGDVVNVNQVSVRSANSAGLTYSEEIQLQSYADAAIWMAPQDGLPGSIYPRGTPSDPVDNIVDASTLVEKYKFDRVHLDGTLYMVDQTGAYSTINEIENVRIVGNTASHTNVISTTLQSKLSGVVAENLYASGLFECVTDVTLDRCVVNNISGFRGTMKQCQLAGTTIMTTGATGIQSFLWCASHVPGNSAPVVDMNSCVSDLEFRYYAGGIHIKNFNQGQSASIDMVAGHVKIDSTCTSGTFVIRGQCKVTNLASGNSGLSVNTDHATNIQLEGVDRMTKLIPATL